MYVTQRNFVRLIPALLGILGRDRYCAAKDGCKRHQNLFHTKIYYAVYYVEQLVLLIFMSLQSRETREERALTGRQVRAGILGN